MICIPKRDWHDNPTFMSTIIRKFKVFALILWHRIGIDSLTPYYIMFDIRVDQYRIVCVAETIDYFASCRLAPIDTGVTNARPPLFILQWRHITVVASQITDNLTVCPTIYSVVHRATDLCEGNSSWPMVSHHKRPVMRKTCPRDDVIV